MHEIKRNKKKKRKKELDGVSFAMLQTIYRHTNRRRTTTKAAAKKYVYKLKGTQCIRSKKKK